MGWMTDIYVGEALALNGVRKWSAYEKLQPGHIKGITEEAKERKGTGLG